MCMNKTALFSLFKSDANEFINQGIPLMAGSGSGLSYDERTGQNEQTGIYILRNYNTEQLDEVCSKISKDPTRPYIPLLVSGVVNQSNFIQDQVFIKMDKI